MVKPPNLLRVDGLTQVTVLREVREEARWKLCAVEREKFLKKGEEMIS
jgi:hypothetical protein